MDKKIGDFLFIIRLTAVTYLVIFLCIILALGISRNMNPSDAIMSAVFIFVTMLVPVGIMFWLTIIAIVIFLMPPSKKEES